jgi:hypothetical protein
VSVIDMRQDSGPDRPRAHEEGTARDVVQHREYSRPQAFFVGPATKLVRGDLYGKYSDGYTGYYVEA